MVRSITHRVSSANVTAPERAPVESKRAPKRPVSADAFDATLGTTKLETSTRTSETTRARRTLGDGLQNALKRIAPNDAPAAIRELGTLASSKRQAVRDNAQALAHGALLSLFTSPDDGGFHSVLENDPRHRDAKPFTLPSLSLAERAQLKTEALLVLLMDAKAPTTVHAAALRELGAVAKPSDVKRIEALVAPTAHPAVLSQLALAKAAIARGTSMGVTFVAMEARPFCGTGGLGNVMAELPIAMKGNGHTVDVLLPLQGAITDEQRAAIKPTGIKAIVPGPGGDETIELHHSAIDGVDYWFIANETYFPQAEKSIYGASYGTERFSFNAHIYDFLGAATPVVLRAIAEHRGTRLPDVIQLNDSHTASAAAHLQRAEDFAESRTVMGVHNLGGIYQGKFAGSMADELRIGALNLMRAGGSAELSGDVCFMKMGLTLSDGVCHVSTVYKNETLSEELGEGMHGIQRTVDAKERLTGIQHGINTTVWDPKTDPCLDHHFDIDDLSGKAAAKADMQREYGLAVAPNVPLISLVARLTEQKGLIDVVQQIERALANDAAVQFLIVSSHGDMPIDEARPSLRAWLTDMARQHPDRIALDGKHTPAKEHRVLAASDGYLMPSLFEPCGLPQMYAIRNLTPPIVRAVGGLEESVTDYDAKAGTGNGFKFTTDLGGALDRFLDWYNNGDRKQLLGNCAKTDLSWEARAVPEYNAFYRGLLHRPKVGSRALPDYSRHPAPHDKLAPRTVRTSDGVKTVVRHIATDAAWARVIRPGHEPVMMKKVGEAFEATIDGGDYHFESRVDSASPWRSAADPYAFSSTVDPSDLYLFGIGKLEDVQRVLGAREITHEGVRGFAFTTWAPNAQDVQLVGDWNGWGKIAQPMRKLGDSGVWELFVPGVAAGARYGLSLSHNGQRYEKPDLCARAYDGEQSVTVAKSDFAWSDAAWMAARAVKGANAPRASCEVYLGRERAADGSFNSYAELARSVIERSRANGFTHVHLVGLLEHTDAASLGYRVSGYFAPTTRHGSIEDFKGFVNACHAAGLGVSADWPIGDFPSDGALARFDGTHLFDHHDGRKGEHKSKGTRAFNYGRNEVRAFLQGSAAYLIGELHLDGLRVPETTRMLYLDYERHDTGWEPNARGGNENLEAIDFLRQVNTMVRTRFAGASVVADEASGWSGVTSVSGANTLSFHDNVNTGWARDLVGWFMRDDRSNHLDPLVQTSRSPALTHDIVDGALLERLGEARTKALLAILWTSPGQKLADASLLEKPAIAETVRQLNALYLSQPALQSSDSELLGAAQGVVAAARHAKRPEDSVIMLHNTTSGDVRYRVGVDSPGAYRAIFGVTGSIQAERVAAHGKPFSLDVTLPANSVALWRR